MANGKKIAQIIAEKKLSTERKYEAFRKANPRLKLPSAEEVRVLHTARGWKW